MSEVTLTWVYDAGHEWLEVVGDAALARACSTGYDYVSGETVYLECDISAGIYLEARGFRHPEIIAIGAREWSPRHLERLEAGPRGLARLGY